MTTDLIVRTNGAYVCEGTVNVGGTVVQVKVGPNAHNAPPAQQSINVPHGQPVSASLHERNATAQEIHHANAGHAATAPDPHLPDGDNPAGGVPSGVPSGGSH